MQENDYQMLKKAISILGYKTKLESNVPMILMEGTWQELNLENNQTFKEQEQKNSETTGPYISFNYSFIGEPKIEVSDTKDGKKRKVSFTDDQGEVGEFSVFLQGKETDICFWLDNTGGIYVYDKNTILKEKTELSFFPTPEQNYIFFQDSTNQTTLICGRDRIRTGRPSKIFTYAPCYELDINGYPLRQDIPLEEGAKLSLAIAYHPKTREFIMKTMYDIQEMFPEFLPFIDREFNAHPYLSFNQDSYEPHSLVDSILGSSTVTKEPPKVYQMIHKDSQTS